MLRCPMCASSDTPGWVEDGYGAEEPCPRCTIKGAIHGSGYLHEDGRPVPIEKAPNFLGTAITQTCPTCGFRNIISGWEYLFMFRCRSCRAPIEVHPTVN